MVKVSQDKDSTFNNKSKRLLDIMCDLELIAETYGVDVVFRYQERLGGEAISRKQKIKVYWNEYMSVQCLLSVFFHELAHCRNYINKKFLAFHSMTDPSRMTTEHIKLVLLTGLRAERYTDKIGAKLMKEYYPEIKFIAYYSKKGVEKEFRNHHLGAFVEALDKRDDL